MSEIKVSVIIPTLNSGETLEECLASVRANKSKYSFEIIVVDAGSTDETLKIASKYADKLHRGVPNRINRNIGIKNAEGDIICFTDSDCVVPDDWIDTLVDGLRSLHTRDAKVVGVGGCNLPFQDSCSLSELAIAKAMRSPFISFKARNTAVYKDVRPVLHNPPINSALFKWVIEEIGGFREEPGYPEDLDLDIRINKGGYKLFYLPYPVVWHRHKTDPKKFATQMRDFGKKRVRVNREHPEFARLYHYGPMVLYFMLHSPLCFLPLTLALLNALFVVAKEKNIRLFGVIFRLTLSFYINYGKGEAEVLLKEREGK
jgi:glycosyltransferase involved in cell wall biosynthesis